jgi:glutamate dehydrogenase
VDTSDREVNLKIVLRLAIERGVTDAAQREALLAAMADEVAEQVLRNVYLQTWTISQELAQSPGGMPAYELLMTDLEEADDRPAAGRLNREIEALPSTAEMQRRQSGGAGLTRPELAVLLGYAKTDHIVRLLRSELPDVPALRSVLDGYFPPLVVNRFGELLAEHPLRRELIATWLANDLVNRMGITYVSRTAHELGVMAYEVAAAYWIARQVCSADDHWRSIERLDGQIDPALQLELKASIDRLVDAHVRHYIRTARGPGRITETVERDRPAFAQLQAAIEALGSKRRRAARRQRSLRLVDLGVDAEFAERIVGLTELTLVPDVAAVAAAEGQDVRHVADVFMRVADELAFDRLQARLQAVEPRDDWDAWEQRGLTDELRDIRRSAAIAAMRAYPDGAAEHVVEAFLAERGGRRQRVRVLFDRLEREESPRLAAIAVAVRAVRDLLDRGPSADRGG